MRVDFLVLSFKIFGIRLGPFGGKDLFRDKGSEISNGGGSGVAVANMKTPHNFPKE